MVSLFRLAHCLVWTIENALLPLSLLIFLFGKLFLDLVSQICQLLHDCVELLLSVVLHVIHLTFQALYCLCLPLIMLLKLNKLLNFLFRNLNAGIIRLFRLSSTLCKLIRTGSQFADVLLISLLGLGRVEKSKPVQQLRVLLECFSVLGVPYNFVVIQVNLSENLQNFTLVYPHMTVNEAAPMRYDLREVFVELFKGYLPIHVVVHQSKTKHVLLTLGPVAQNVHDCRKLTEVYSSVPVGVEHVKDAICKKGVLLLAKQSQLCPKSFFRHHVDFLIRSAPIFVGAFYLLPVRHAAKVLFQLVKFFFGKSGLVVRFVQPLHVAIQVSVGQYRPISELRVDSNCFIIATLHGLHWRSV